jgi:hypothetical protein
MVVYRCRILGLWGIMGFGWADNVCGRLVGSAVARTTCHALVVGRYSLNRGRRRASGGGAHSRRSLFRSELTAQQLNLRWRCDAGRLVGDGPCWYMYSRLLKSEHPVIWPWRAANGVRNWQRSRLWRLFWGRITPCRAVRFGLFAKDRPFVSNELVASVVSKNNPFPSSSAFPFRHAFPLPPTRRLVRTSGCG